MKTSGNLGNKERRRALLIAGLGLALLLTVGAASANQPVGSTAKSPLTLAVSSDCPGQWQVVSSSNTGSGDNSLLAVAAVSANDVWAAGGIGTSSGQILTNQTLIEHWNGSAWSIVPNPNPGHDNNTIFGLAAVSANDVWAVGYSDNSTLVEHWNGSAWSVVPSPNDGPLQNTFYAASAVSANDVWAVGIALQDGGGHSILIEHWNGSAWSIVPGPASVPDKSGLFSIAAVSANDVWAVGNFTSDGKFQTLTIHWNGSAWSVVASPSPGSTTNTLFGVAAASANDVWAVGAYIGASGSAAQTLVEHWNGSAWSAVASPNPGSSSHGLYGVTALADDDVWTIGYYVVDGGFQALLEHWNGSAWSVMPSASVNGTNNFRAIDAVSATDVWAVGNYKTTANQTLTEHYIANCPTPTPAPAPTVSTPPTIPGNGSRIFPETGKSVRGIFFDYWNTHGGLPQQGFPISELLSEISDLNGKSYTVQYFERAIFEYHPENQPPYDILLSQLGTFRYREKYPNGAPGQQANSTAGSVLFNQTGHRVGGKFLDYWNTHGGLAQQGFPISEEFNEVSPLDGKTYHVQYFERAVFEAHPENQLPYDVLLSQLGTFRYKQKHP
jgi:hypothetical protein